MPPTIKAADMMRHHDENCKVALVPVLCSEAADGAHKLAWPLAVGFLLVTCEVRGLAGQNALSVSGERKRSEKKRGWDSVAGAMMRKKRERRKSWDEGKARC